METNAPYMRAVDKALLEIGRACATGSVIRDRDILHGYASDESEASATMPEAVVRVQNTAEVAAVLRSANKHSVPVTPRAGGTSRVGGSVPSPGSIVLSVENMEEIKGVERDDHLAVVEPGVITGALHRTVEAEGLFYPPDPNSLDSCRIGGNIGANAAGPRTYKYGVTSDYVLGLEAVTAEGTILQLGRRTAKGVAGYDLTSLLVGSEGTLAVVTEATLRLIPRPEEICTLMVFLPDHAAIAKAVHLSLTRRLTPRCVELLDSVALEILRPQAGLHIPTGARAMLLVELDGSSEDIERDLEKCGETMFQAGALDVLVAKNQAERARLWAGRRELSYSLRRAANHKLSEDVVVPRSQMAPLLDHCQRLAESESIVVPTYGHAGDGNLHVNFLWDNPDQRPNVDRAIHGLFTKVLELGGTISGEHGIGVLKAPYLPMEQSAHVLSLQRQIKAVFDPKGILNPGKIFSPDSPPHHGGC